MERTLPCSESFGTSPPKDDVTVELVAPTVGGVEADDGAMLDVDQRIHGAPSVLYDAVIVLASEDGASSLARNPAARDFISDAYAHCKFVGYVTGALPLLRGQARVWAGEYGGMSGVVQLIGLFPKARTGVELSSTSELKVEADVMAGTDKVQNKAQVAKGKVKEAAGEATGNDRLKAKGQADEVKGNLKQAGEKVKDAVKRN